MTLRHKIPFRAPGGWFTAEPFAAAATQATSTTIRRQLRDAPRSPSSPR